MSSITPNVKDKKNKMVNYKCKKCAKILERMDLATFVIASSLEKVAADVGCSCSKKKKEARSVGQLKKYIFDNISENFEFLGVLDWWNEDNIETFTISTTSSSTISLSIEYCDLKLSGVGTVATIKLPQPIPVPGESSEYGLEIFVSEIDVENKNCVCLEGLKSPIYLQTRKHKVTVYWDNLHGWIVDSGVYLTSPLLN
jgi:hypothetical protein